jgi:hypothetical protein
MSKYYTPPGQGSKGTSSGSKTGSTKPSNNAKKTSSKAGSSQAQRQQLPPSKKQVVESFVAQNKGNLTPQQQGAYNQLLSGGDLSFENRSTLTDSLASSQVPEEVREAISEGLKNDEANRRATGKVHDRRYLQIKNSTKEPLRVFVQYHTRTTEDKWVWYPENPQQSSKATSFVIEPGKNTYLEIEEWRLNANRVRVWAKSTGSGTEWMEYRTQDLWLVPEIDEEKHHRYYAAHTESYPFEFTP